MSRLLAAVYDRWMTRSEVACLASWRAELLAGLRGVVLEIGAGTGANLHHYPPAVRRLVLCEPDRFMRAHLAGKAAAGTEILDAPVERLPFADATFDAVVSTLVLCSVADPRTALAEIRRVLRPGGQLYFIEHVAAEDDRGRLRWQRWLEPVWRVIAGNCHLTRRTEAAIEGAGLVLEEVRRESVRKALPIVRPSIRGRARKAAATA